MNDKTDELELEPLEPFFQPLLSWQVPTDEELADLAEIPVVNGIKQKQVLCILSADEGRSVARLKQLWAMAYPKIEVIGSIPTQIQILVKKGLVETVGKERRKSKVGRSGRLPVMYALTKRGDVMRRAIIADMFEPAKSTDKPDDKLVGKEGV